MTTMTQPVSAPNAARPGNGIAQARLARLRRRRWIADLLVMLLWASGAAAASLYLASGGLATWTSPGGVITGLGILAGLVGSDFVLVMLVLGAVFSGAAAYYAGARTPVPAKSQH